PVMVISHGLWQRYFGGDPSVVGRTLEWNHKPVTVVGVLPRGFEYPKGAEVWTPAIPDFPATLEAKADPSKIMVFYLVGRLLPDVSKRAAREDYEAFLRSSDAERRAAERGMRPVVTPLPQLIAGDVRATLWAAAAAVGLLLLIASANVANLLLIRGSARTHE